MIPPPFRRIPEKIKYPNSHFFERSAKHLRFLCEKCEMGHQKMYNLIKKSQPEIFFLARDMLKRHTVYV
jgi:hypothetical protein